MKLRESEKRLIEAVSTIIKADGFSKVGVNRIAKEAGYDKVLIYRYFGGLEGLMAEWAKENDFYATAFYSFYKEIEEAKEDEIQELTKKVLIAQLHFLKSNVMMQELLLWELLGESRFKAIQEIREQNGQKLQQSLEKHFGVESKNVSLYITILITSINFITLYTRQYPVMNGVDFTKDESWLNLENVISDYIDMLFKKLKL